MIEIKNIDKHYKDVHALKGIDALFASNKITGLIGYNGSGKTTTFNIMVKYLTEFNGEVLFDGKELTTDMLKHISFLSYGGDENNSDSVRNQLLYFAIMYGYSKNEALVIIDALAIEFYFDFNLKDSLKKLSKGNRQKVKLAQTFINPFAKYYLLDEPFDGLDPLMVKKISAKIIKRKENSTIIITSHRLNVIDQMCDDYYVLKKGEVVAQKSVHNTSDFEIHVNPEMDEKIFKGKFIKSVSKNDKYISIKIVSKDDFLAINKLAIAKPNFKWISLVEKSLSESVFEEYEDE